jgi:hypothetical protein
VAYTPEEAYNRLIKLFEGQHIHTSDDMATLVTECVNGVPLLLEHIRVAQATLLDIACELDAVEDRDALTDLQIWQLTCCIDKARRNAWPTT